MLFVLTVPGRLETVLRECSPDIEDNKDFIIAKKYISCTVEVEVKNWYTRII